MSQYADYFKTRIFMAMPVKGIASKKRLAHWTAQALDVFEKTPSGVNLLKRMPSSVYFSMRKTLMGNYGKAFGGDVYVGLACDKLHSLKEVVPVLAHECAHIMHFAETKATCLRRSLMEDFMFEYLSEVGARLQEKNIIQEVGQRRILSYEPSFFEKNPQFYGPCVSVAAICRDVDSSYLNDFLQGGLEVSCKENDSASIHHIKTYFQKRYPVLTPQIYRHIRAVFLNKANEALAFPERYRLTRYKKCLLRQCVSRERD